MPRRTATTVIIVESDATLRQFISRLLSKKAERIVLAESAAEMFERVTDESDCLLVYNTYAGWEPLFQLRARGARVPIILLLSPSASVNEEHVSIVSPVATLSIPFRPQDLQEAVMRAVAQTDPGRSDR
jgi:CheY-like chemotaxis protein